MAKIFSAVIFSIILLLINTELSSGQEEKNISQKRTTPARAAEGQTKWMINQLKLDSTLFPLIYKVNYKYQVKLDSVRMVDMNPSEKSNIYLIISQEKNKELKKIFMPQVYKAYIVLIESVKEKAIQNQNIP